MNSTTQKAIRVLQVYDTAAKNSGIANVIVNWMRNIDNNKVHMDFLSCWQKDPNYTQDIIQTGNAVYYLQKNSKITNYFKFIQNTKDFFKHNAKEYDIIHLHEPLLSYPILHYAKKYGAPKCIVHVHSCALGNTKIKSARNKVTMIAAKKCADEFWACSKEAAKEWYSNNGINEYTIVNNGIELERFRENKQDRTTIRKQLNIADDEIVIGHISNMTPIKNLPFLFDVINGIKKNTPKVKLLLVGRNKLPDTLSREPSYKTIKNDIIIAGERGDVEKYIQAFDICMMPSTSEGYGLVPIEVQLARKPVIVSNAYPSIIKKTPLCIVKDLELDKWINSFKLVISNESLIKNRFDQKYFKQFDIKTTTDLVTTKYASILVRRK